MLVGKVALHGAGMRKDIECATVIIDGTKELGAVDNNAYSFKVERRTLVHPHVGGLPQRNADAARLTGLYGDGAVLDRAQRRAEVNRPISRRSSQLLWCCCHRQPCNSMGRAAFFRHAQQWPDEDCR